MTPDHKAALDRMLQGLASGELSGAEETYAYEWRAGSVTWNITQAQALIVQGRAVGWNEVPRDQLQRVAERYDYDEATIARADPRVPGIAAPILDQGQTVYVIIDGIHRAVRAYRDGQPFIVLILSDEDSRSCILGNAEGLVP